MRSASNGLASTLLLLVPLVAVPFAAAIGLPQLSATPAADAIGQPDVRPVGRDNPAAAESGPHDESQAFAQPSADDLFAPLNTAGAARLETSYEEAVSADARAAEREARVRSRLAALAATSEHVGGSGGPSPRDSRALANAAPAVRDDAFDDAFEVRADARLAGEPSRGAAPETRDEPRPFDLDRPFADPADDPARAASTPEFTWESAVRRMNELGIEDFALSPGGDDRGFHFCCQLSDAGDSGVTHRFEAEAADPLAAVADTIEQVEGWLRQTAAVDAKPALDHQLARLGQSLEPNSR